MQTSNHKKREVDLFQQISRDAEPFHIEWLWANSLPCSTVPIRRVALITFFAMQVGVHPRTLHAFVLLSRCVGQIPIALGIPPQADERECEFRRRCGCGERLTNILPGHWVLRD